MVPGFFRVSGGHVKGADCGPVTKAAGGRSFRGWSVFLTEGPKKKSAAPGARARKKGGPANQKMGPWFFSSLLLAQSNQCF